MRTALLAVCAVLALAATGCTSLSEQETALVAERRARAVAIIDGIAEGLREKQPQTITAMLHPRMPIRDRMRLTQMAQGAIIVASYSDYKADAEQAVMDVAPRKWLGSRIHMEVPGTNIYDDKLVEPLTLSDYLGELYIVDMNLAVPVPGTELDLDEETIASVAKVTGKVIDLMREGKGGHIEVMLAEGDANRFHTEIPDFWERLFLGSELYRVPVITEVKHFERLIVRQWPDPAKDMHPIYASEGRIRTVYRVPYSWPDGNIIEDTLDLEIYVANREGEWHLETLRFYGDAFYSK